jgi:RNA polymerase sigma-B factor
VAHPESGSDVETEHLLAEYHRTSDPTLRERLIETHEPLVRFLTSKFKDRGEPFEDLVQVGTIGLIQAIDRFEPERGNRFSTYAIPTIIGEIRRYLRDRAWHVRVPRRLQELNAQAARANEQLTAMLGRPPSVAEIAAAIRASESETLEAMEMGHVHQMVSLESPVKVRGESLSMAVEEIVGAPDPNLEKFDRYATLHTAVHRLNERERRIVLLRFFYGLSQTEIAQRLQISQMHVSRLQQRALSHLKALLAEEEEEPPPPAP